MVSAFAVCSAYAHSRKGTIVKPHITRRDVLALLAGTGAAAACGGLGCAGTRPTRPSKAIKPARGQALALTNAKIVDVETGAHRCGPVLLVRDGLIAGLFDPADRLVEKAHPVDCDGGYLIPGLINAHSHLNMPSFMDMRLADLGLVRRQIVRNYADAICWGVTTVRDMTSVPKIMARDRAAIDAGRLPGPHILTPISFLSVPDGYPDFGGVPSSFAELFTGRPTLRTTDPAVSREFVREVAARGADLVKIGFDHRSFLWGRGDRVLPVLADAQVEAIVDEAHRLDLPVAAHHLYAQGLARGLRFGVDCMEHVQMDRPLTDDDVRAVVDADLPLVPTLTIVTALAFAAPDSIARPAPVLAEARAWRDNVQMAELPRHCVPEMAKRSKDIDRFYRNAEYTLPANAGRVAFDPLLASTALPVAFANVSRLVAAGATLGVGNDSGVPFIFPGMVHLEMELLVKAGMSPAQALRAATLTNARIAGVADRCGSIEQGKRADLALLAGDPVDDVRNVGKVLAVFKDGALVSAAEGFQPEPQA